MDNKLIMENYLLVLKSTVEVFVHGTLESANQDIRDVLKSGLDTILERQAKTYLLMMKYGWYPKENIASDAINKILLKIKGEN